MVKKNKHKYYAKATVPTGEMESDVVCSASNSLNYSRTLGNSKNWIGTGFMHKSGGETDHLNINFPFYSLVYVVSGSGSYTSADGKTYLLAAGSVFERRPGVVHSSFVDVDSGWKEYYLDCNTELYEQLCSMVLIAVRTPVYSNAFDTELAKEIEALMDVLRSAPEESVFDAYIKYLEILRTTFPSKNTSIHDEMIASSLTDFDQMFKARFDLKDHCKKRGWGYEKFRKAFKQNIGVSPKDYLIRKRMDEACRLLRSTNNRISEISDELGYSSQYEFSNQFKRYFNVFPKHYRDGV